MRWHTLASILLVSAGVFVAACGGGNKSPQPGAQPQPSATEEVTPSGPPLSDQEYVQTLCVGITNYNEALLREPTAEGIAKVVREFSTSMKKVNSPEDLKTFHADFIQYLDDAVDDPTSLVTTTPPKPADAIRERLAKRVLDTAECKYPTFLGEKRNS